MNIYIYICLTILCTSNSFISTHNIIVRKPYPVYLSNNDNYNQDNKPSNDNNNQYDKREIIRAVVGTAYMEVFKKWLLNVRVIYGMLPRSPKKNVSLFLPFFNISRFQ